MENRKVAVVLVTFNRLELLKGALENLFKQEYQVSEIFVINNNSSDGTKEYLEELKEHHDNLFVDNLTQNIGGAGGFSEGIELAYSQGPFDYYWVMDDDTYPKADALKEFMISEQRLQEPIGFLSSNVLWINGEPADMNIPNVAHDWNARINDNVIKLDSASFVSMLISNQAVETFGLPISEFFIWGDDIEYSGRISKKLNSYFVNKSTAIHKTKANNGIYIITEEPSRLNRYYLGTRNKVYCERKAGFKDLIKYLLNRLVLIGKILTAKNCDARFKKIGIIIKGVWSGFWFNPKIKYVTKKH